MKFDKGEEEGGLRLSFLRLARSSAWLGVASAAAAIDLPPEAARSGYVIAVATRTPDPRVGDCVGALGRRGLLRSLGRGSEALGLLYSLGWGTGDDGGAETPAICLSLAFSRLSRSITRPPPLVHRPVFSFSSCGSSSDASRRVQNPKRIRPWNQRSYTRGGSDPFPSCTNPSLARLSNVLEHDSASRRSSVSDSDL